MSAPRLPRCADYGGPNPGIVSRQQGGHVWLCGSCEYKRDHPDAKPATKLPRERTKRLQRESLFDG